MAQVKENKIREYLLGQASEAEEEQIEMLLVTDPDFVAEYDIVVNEVTDDYIAGRFEGAELAQVEGHFFKSDERQSKLKFAQALKQRKAELGTDKGARKGWFKPLLAIAASLLLLAGGGFYLWRVSSNNSDLNKGLAALQSAFREERPLEARISKFDYAPYLSTRGREKDNIDQDELRRAELILLDAVKKNPTAAVHHGLGKVYLAKKDFDKAIKEFDEALKGEPKNAQVYSDLGAAWLEKGRIDVEGKERGRGFEELARGFGNLTTALELNPNFLEARFNRALCYRLQMLPAKAAEDYREYLKRDSASPWAEEATKELKHLEDQKNQPSASKEKLLEDFRAAFENQDDQTAWLIVSRHRDLSGGPIANTLIDSYLEAANKGQRAEASKTLSALRYVARLELEKAGDLFVRDVARFIETSSESQRHSLVEARQLLKLGREGLQQSKGPVTETYLARAKAMFEQIGDNAEALYADYPIGHFYLQQLKSNLSLSVFDRVVRQCEARRYRWLQAQALNATANVQIGLINLSAALEASNRSLKLSQQIGDTAGVKKTTNQLAQQYFRLGNYSKSLDLHQESLALAYDGGTEPIQFWRTYFTIPFPLTAMGLHAAAIEYEKESLRWAEQANVPPVTVSRSYSLLGMIYGAQGNYAEALRNADLATERAQQIPDKIIRQQAIAYTALQRGFIHRQSGDLAKSMADYDQAIKLYDELGKFQAFIYLAQKGKLLSCMQQGCASIEEEIKSCLAWFEQYRSTIREVSNREPFFDAEQDINDIAIDYEFSRKNFQTAFEYSERARARSLLDLASKTTMPVNEPEPDLKVDSTTQTKDFAILRAEVPAETQVLEYAVLKDKLVVWLISSTGFAHAETGISRANLDEILLRYLKLLSNPSEDTEALRRDGAVLYDTLIKPIEGSLKKDKLLCVVPDKTLNYLPFASLISSSSGKYLMNEYRLTMAPSAEMFVRSSKFATEKGKSENERLLVVGNPRFSRERFPELADLPAAEREVDAIRRLYERSRPRALIGAEATKALLQSEMQRSDVVHLALHSIVDEQLPLRSKLVLAAGRDRDELSETDVLQAYEIYKADLPLTRLVVLSACESGVGRYYGGEGIMGLSSAFIAARVPLVIASLWRVDSDPTADLMIDFHQLRTREKLSTVEALQLAQQHMATGANTRYRHPYYWAAFTVVGGYAKF